MIGGLARIGVWGLWTAGLVMNTYGAAVDRADGIREYQIESRLENDRQVLSAVHQCLRQGDTRGEFVVTGKNYTPEGSILRAFYGDSLEYSSSLEDTRQQNGDKWETVRFSVAWNEQALDEEAVGDGNYEKDDTGQDEEISGKPGGQYWQLGDSVIREIEGDSYVFRCIDQNYQNVGTAGQQGALFLCDSVIPADVGAQYVYEKQEDGSYDYVYYPGPIADFGDTGSYKQSRVRRWLDSAAEEDWGLLQVDLGVNYGYTGQTQEGEFARLDAGDLVPQPLGYQKMTGELFLLSVEEALQYRQHLWRFGVGLDEEENPETQIGSFRKGYWLRSPYGEAGQAAGGQAETESVYVVDLAEGTIRPQPVTGFLGGLGIIGVRPVFVLPQKSGTL